MTEIYRHRDFASSASFQPLLQPASDELPERSAWLVGLEAFFVRTRPYFWGIQGVMFVLFLAVLGLPLLLPDPPAETSPLSNGTLALQYLLWVIWFPLVFLSVIVFGRIWCGLLCPMGAARK